MTSTRTATTKPKGKARPVKQTVRNPKAITPKTALPGSAQAEATARVEGAQLAQLVNLHIGGYSLAEIGAAIGATEAEVDRMLTQDVGRYVRSQPALRIFVRNFISEKYLGLLEASYPQATDPNNPKQLEYQDRVLRTLAQVGKLHGAEMPVQAELKVDAAPEIVQTMVEALAANQGLSFDASIFDEIEDADVIEAHDESVLALEQASDAVTDGDEEF